VKKKYPNQKVQRKKKKKRATSSQPLGGGGKNLNPNDPGMETLKFVPLFKQHLKKMKTWVSEEGKTRGIVGTLTAKKKIGGCEDRPQSRKKRKQEGNKGGKEKWERSERPPKGGRKNVDRLTPHRRRKKHKKTRR